MLTLVVMEDAEENFNIVFMLTLAIAMEAGLTLETEIILKL